MSARIELADIRKGDLIRWESSSKTLSLTASEFRAEGDGGGFMQPGTHYLLDRPTPPIELPTDDHHFGWITAPGTSLARPRVAGEWFFGEVALRASGLDGINRQKVTEWIPGILVPKAALDGLREHAATAPDPAWGRIQTFLRAVDAVNGAIA